MNSSFKINKLFNSRKGTSPIIATLLLVAIAVVGGVVNFTMSQEYFNTAQASGLSGIES
ncbi:MAG: archaellin/type IV pilin N-terminal domain-containing protein, partial [Candidatus Nitrosomaritimum aestuariumsis]